MDTFPREPLSSTKDSRRLANERGFGYSPPAARPANTQTLNVIAGFEYCFLVANLKVAKSCDIQIICAIIRKNSRVLIMASNRYFWFAGATPNRLCLSLLFFLPLKSPSRALGRHSISVCNPLYSFDIAILEPIKWGNLRVIQFSTAPYIFFLTNIMNNSILKILYNIYYHLQRSTRWLINFNIFAQLRGRWRKSARSGLYSSSATS